MCLRGKETVKSIFLTSIPIIKAAGQNPVILMTPWLCYIWDNAALMPSASQTSNNNKKMSERLGGNWLSDAGSGPLPRVEACDPD